MLVVALCFILCQAGQISDSDIQGTVHMIGVLAPCQV